MIARPDGLPGKGVANYLADRYGNDAYRRWGALNKKTKRKLVYRERDKILQYKKWQRLNDIIFGRRALHLQRPEGSEADGRSADGKNHGGSGESIEHKKLKAWVAAHPMKVGVRSNYGKGNPESPLLSGDTVDVLFSKGTEYVVVEVKSCRSNDVDLQRGIYQCVKYRKVKEAEHAPIQVKVRSLLVTERELNNELSMRARLLGVKWKCVKVNPP